MKNLIFSENYKCSISNKESKSEGFTLIEVVISLIILLVALLGVVSIFNLTITYNSGNNSRSQALAVLQQETEQLRSLKFTSTAMDSKLAGGTKSPKFTTMPNGSRFRVDIVIDDDPFTAGIQTNNNMTLKEITVTVKNDSIAANNWSEGFETKTVLRRVRGN